MGEQNKEVKFYDAETGAEVVRQDLDESSPKMRFWCNGKGGFCREENIKSLCPDGCRFYDGTGGDYFLDYQVGDAFQLRDDNWCLPQFSFKNYKENKNV